MPFVEYYSFNGEGEGVKSELMKRAALNHIEKVQPPYDAIIQQNGYEAVCLICDMMGGSTIYVPTKKTIFRKCIEEEARCEYDGSNFSDVMKKYEMSNTYLRKIINNET